MKQLLFRCWGVLLILLGMWLPTTAQDRTVSGKVSNSEDASALPGVSIVVKGTTKGTTTDSDGNFKVIVPTGATLIFSYIGYVKQEVRVGNGNTIDVSLVSDANSLDEVVVTALGIKKEKRALGYATTEVKGDELAQTQRDNFLNALQGRVPGANIVGTSGMPGASTQIVLRGINSISGNNQPLFVIDGLPVSNNTFGSGNLVADRSSATSISNRTVDFANRIADINPNDIESVTILKGPEAAALYGIEAANGAVVITTKKGSAGEGRITYSNRTTFQKVANLPVVQTVYSNGTAGIPRDDIFNAFGPKYPENAQLFDNVNNFFQTGKAQQHNLVFSGGTANGGTTYRLSTSYTLTEGVIPTTRYERLNFALAGTSKIGKKITNESTLQYAFTKNRKVSRGQNSFLLGLVQWPVDDDVSQFLTAGGSRRRITAGTEVENPYFDISKNRLEDKGNRFLVNTALHYDPVAWLRLTGRVGLDISNQNYLISYHPESNRAGGVIGGGLDQSSDVTRDFNLQYHANAHKKFGKLDLSMLVGGALIDRNYSVLSTRGEKFFVPDFISINNTDPLTQKSLSNMTQKRLVSALGNFQASYNDMLYVTITGRNDWTSTLLQGQNSFFYPSISTSFVFTELLKGNNILSFGKLRASYAQVGKDAPPYALYPALEAQTTTGGGFAYGFTAPAPYLRPEKINSYEVGMDLKFFKGRLGIDAAYYETISRDQIITGLRGSYGTGFVLKNINGGELKNWGTEVAITVKPFIKKFRWESTINFNSTASRLEKISDQIPEYYDSDTWVYGNIRNGIRLGGPLTTFTGNSYQRNTKGDILISPVSGLPLNNTLWEIVADRNPRYTVGFLNNMTYKSWNLSFLWDFRNGGDVFNATESYLYNRGLSKNTLDRETPRIFGGVLKDGLENTDTPTQNSIIVTPYYTNSYYTSLSDENFIEHDIKWARLRDITVRYSFMPAQLKKIKAIKSASLFFTGTDLMLFTNYSGGDPGVNATNVNKGGSGGGGIDYGNLPVPKVYNLGLSVTF